MKSIRGQLFGWLLLGSGVLWLLAGVGIFFTIRAGLQARFDAELSYTASGVRLFVPGQGDAARRGPASLRWQKFHEADSGLYFQAWTAEGTTYARSASLGERELPRPAGLTPEPSYWNFKMPNGEAVRATGGQVVLRASGADPVKIDVVVARDRAELDQTLLFLVGGISMVGLLVGLGYAVLVRFAVVSSLKPLARVGDQVAAIDAGSLQARFEPEGMPREVLPIMERLNELMSRLEESFERERRFSSDLAHELRTPVAELKTVAEVALKWPDDGAEENFRGVLEIAGQMQEMIEGLLALARWERDPGNEEHEAVSLARLVEECWRPYEEQAAAKSLVVRQTIPDDLTLATQPGMFRLIVTNLLSNAVEYTPPGGDILVEGGSPGQAVAFSVTNSVNGLKPADLPHFFERFWRRERVSTGAGHHGLGLCLAHSCAEALSYELAAELNEEERSLAMRLAKKCDESGVDAPAGEAQNTAALGKESP